MLPLDKQAAMEKIIDMARAKRQVLIEHREYPMLSDDEAEEAAGPRTAAWPKAVLRTLRRSVKEEEERMLRRPPLPRYDFED